MRSVFGFLVLGVLPAACSSSQKATPTPMIPIVESASSPQSYELAAPSCQSAPDSPTTITSATADAWSMNQLAPKVLAFHDASSATSLTTPAISNTRYADFFWRLCDFDRPNDDYCGDGNGGQLAWGRDDSKSPGALKICQDTSDYPRRSYESVALSSAYYLQKAKDRYHQLAVTAGAAEPNSLMLSVLPQFITYYDHYMDPADGSTKRLETFVTHNLAYFPDNQMIAVFPEPATQTSTDPSFWESEFVLNHEFGHHIDYTRHGKVLSAIGLKWSPLEHAFVDVAATAAGLEGTTGRAQVAGATAEGFADMVAYFAGGANANTLDGLPDIGFNRDIGRGKFSNGDDKILTDERLAYLTGLQIEDPKDEVHYSDIHTAGAIIAYTANEAFLTLTGTNPALIKGSDDEVNARYKLTLSLMDRIVANTADLTLQDTSAKVLEPITDALQTVADAYLAQAGLTGSDGPGDAARLEICETVRQRLPAALTVPYAKGTGC